MTNPKVGIIDYGVGNHASVLRLLSQIGFRSQIIKEPGQLTCCDLLVLPGVGCFPEAIKNLQKSRLLSSIRDYAEEGNPLIGICLGMQLLADSSVEMGLSSTGLGLIPGAIVKNESSLMHIGWNNLDVQKEDSVLWDFNGTDVYFNHSFCYQGEDRFIAAYSTPRIGHEPIVSVINSGDIWGLQFHPEKSQRSGQDLFKRLILHLTSC